MLFSREKNGQTVLKHIPILYPSGEGIHVLLVCVGIVYEEGGQGICRSAGVLGQAFSVQTMFKKVCLGRWQEEIG